MNTIQLVLRIERVGEVLTRLDVSQHYCTRSYILGVLELTDIVSWVYWKIYNGLVVHIRTQIGSYWEQLNYVFTVMMMNIIIYNLQINICISKI